jgi:hypothetical protein
MRNNIGDLFPQEHSCQALKCPTILAFDYLVKSALDIQP